MSWEVSAGPCAAQVDASSDLDRAIPLMASVALQIFPHLSEDEFGAACRAVEDLWRSLDEDLESSQQIRVHYGV